MYYISYEHETFNGIKRINVLGVATKKAAEDVCKRIEETDGYKIIDVSNVEPID